MKHGALIALGLAGCVGSSFEAEELGETESAVKVLRDKCKKHPKKKCVETTVTVNVDGGTLTTPDGLVMEVPFGAVDQPTELVVTATTIDPDPAIGGQGTVYAFEPEGTVFVRPVQITLPLPAGMTAASVYWTKLGSSEFEPIGGTISGTTITAETTHFSLAVVGSPSGVRNLNGVVKTTHISATTRDSIAFDLGANPAHAIVSDGTGGYVAIPAVAGPEGTFTIDNVPVGDYVLRTNNTYLVTSTNTPDLGFSAGGRPVRQPTDNPLIEMSLSGLVPWQAGDQVELISSQADDFGFNIELDSSLEPGHTSAVLPVELLPGGQQISLILGSQGDSTLVGQLRTQTSANGVPYQAMTRIGHFPSTFDMTLAGPNAVAVTLDTDISNDASIALDFRGTAHFAALTADGDPAANPFCDFVCGGIVGVLAQAGSASDGFYTGNADMLLLFDYAGTDLDTGTMNYGSTSSFVGDWGLLFLSRWNAQRVYQLPDTDFPGGGARAPNLIEWVTDSASGAAGPLVPKLTPPRNIQIDGQAFFDGSSTNLTTTATITWSPPAVIPEIAVADATPDCPAGPVPVLYTIGVRRLFVSPN
nr:hypothetical protein [Deltaproteobacteria bacterium]